METVKRRAPRRLGRYLVYDAFAAGGMATVHLGVLQGPAGFSRVVAVKRLLDVYAGDVELRTMFFDEARLASRIHHPNVVDTLDVVSEGEELFVVMEYVDGLSLAQALRASKVGVPCDVAVGIAVEMLAGLHAAHEAKDPSGRSLDLVHRDVSPQNVLVGADGISRVLDFGVARAAWRLRDTSDGSLKGKYRYMAPEQLAWRTLDRRADVFAASAVIWELLVGEPLFTGAPEPGDYRLGGGRIEPPSARGVGVPREIDAVVLRALAVEPDDRYPSARAMADALASVVAPARAPRIEAWLREVGGEILTKRAALVAEVEREAFVASPSTSAAVGALGAVEQHAEERRARAELPTIAPEEAEEKTLAPSAAAARDAMGSRIVRPPRAAVIALLALAFVGVAGVLFAMRLSAKRAVDDAPTSVPHGEPTPNPSGTAAPSAVALPSPVAQAPAEVPVPSASGTTPRSTPSVSVVSPPARRTSPSRTSSPAGSRVVRKTADCQPSYVIDAAGVKHFKPECFDK